MSKYIKYTDNKNKKHKIEIGIVFNMTKILNFEDIIEILDVKTAGFPFFMLVDNKYWELMSNG